MKSDGVREALFPVLSWENQTVDLFRNELSHPAIYEVMKYLSDFSSTWWMILIPLVALIRKRGWSKGLSLVGFTGIAVLICDMISYRLIKAIVVRPRPNFPGNICLASDCWGFVSSHASNTFCAATILTGFLGRRWAIPMYSLATIISFSRVYLGKHYPLDVIGGALLGLAVGAGAIASIEWFKKKLGARINRKQVPAKSDFARHTFFVSIFTGLFCLFSIFYSDRAVAQAFNDPSFAGLRQFCSDITDIGLGAIYVFIALVIYFSSLWILPRMQWFAKHSLWISKVRFASGFSLAALFFVGLFNLLLKILFGRQRPHMTETFESFNFDPVNFHWYWHSFPSGHAQVVFVVATLLSFAWPRFKVLFLLSAFAIALTRVVIHQHFLSDIILGAAIGYLGTTGLYIYQARKTTLPSIEPTQFT